MNKALIWIAIIWLLLKIRKQKNDADLVAVRLASLEKKTNQISAFSRGINSNGYNATQIDSQLKNYIRFVQVDTYADAVAAATGNDPLRIRVLMDSNTNNTANTYDYWPNSIAVDKLETATF